MVNYSDTLKAIYGRKYRWPTQESGMPRLALVAKRARKG